MAGGDLADSACGESDLASILECARDLVIRYDRDIRVLFFNGAAARVYRELLGVSLRVGLRTYDLFASEQRSYWDKINERVLGGESFTEEFSLPDRDGLLRTYEVDYHPTRRGGEVVGFTTFARDVTAARAHEAAVREKHKLESVGVLAGGIAHDFNNLLAAILGNIGLAQQGIAPDTPAINYLNAAEVATLRAADLTRQMLTYAGRAPTVMAPVELGNLVEQLVQLLRSNVPKDVIVSVEAGTGPTWVHGDAVQLQQLIMNLVTNGVEAVGQRAGRVRISVTPERIRFRQKGEGGLSIEPGEYVALVVQDSGCGIEERVRARMFDPFFTTKAGGRGLGLSAMLGILRNHRGSVEVTSEVGKGSRFRVLVPEGPAPVTAVTSSRQRTVNLSGLVLLADDEPAVLEATRASLQRLGFEVVCARDGNDACTQAERMPVDLRLAVLDVSMPGMDGLQVARALRRQRPDLPIVLMSGFSSQDVAGARDARTYFLGKPFQLSELQRTLEQALEG